MQYMTLDFISPNFSHEKLKPGTFEDLVDVFEDRMRNWFLLPVERLLTIPHCQIAAVALLVTYFEGIEIEILSRVVYEEFRRRSVFLQYR